MSTVWSGLFVVFLHIGLCLCGQKGSFIHLRPASMSLEVEEKAKLDIDFSQPVTWNATFVFTYRDLEGRYYNPVSENGSTIRPLPPFNVSSGSNHSITRRVVALRPGHVYIGLNESSGKHNISGLDRVVCDVAVMHQRWLSVLEVVVGWMYFAAWTVSFYPQVFLNWRRKSVVGFNLDFLFLNLTGFFIYSVFNISLYAAPSIRDLYHRLYPIGEIPVRLNDIFFSVHAFLICIVTGVQVALYERGGQRVSRVCTIILALIAAYCTLNVILAGAGVYNWLTFLYNISYVKLFITLIKYIPQAVMNCRRRSTVGWSIGNICLDFTGGLLSIVQMFIIAYNFDDYGSVFGSPTKVGLGIFSVVFDVFFMVQHWCLFPNADRLIESVESLHDSSPSVANMDTGNQGDIWSQAAGAIYRRASDEASLVKNKESRNNVMSSP